MMSRKIDFSQIWGIVQKVISVVEVIQSERFSEGVDALKKEANDVVSEGKETIVAAAKLVSQILDVFKVSRANFLETLDNSETRGILTEFEEEVFKLLK